MTSATQQLRDAYDPFALIYNRDIAENFCRRVWPVIEHLLLARIPEPARILDLCCGSGQMARELIQRGHRVIGLDSSEQMIRIAQGNAPVANFILADARHFALTPTFDAVLSSFNSFAHVSTTAELECIFRNARSALKPGAPLLFDLSMQEQYLQKWRGSFGEVHDDIAWIVRPSFDYASRNARNDITIFRRDRERWCRKDFTFHQRCHLQSEVRAALTKAGFRRVDTFDASQDLGISNEAGRSFFLCS